MSDQGGSGGSSPIRPTTEPPRRPNLDDPPTSSPYNNRATPSTPKSENLKSEVAYLRPPSTPTTPQSYPGGGVTLRIASPDYFRLDHVSTPTASILGFHPLGVQGREGSPAAGGGGGHQGPQPISPPPPAPQISAAELSLLTEASATKNGTFQCTLCSKQFGYKNGLIRHVRLTHVGEKPYQCTICNRRFGYKHILLEHQNLHYGNRPYSCTQCDKRFAARSNLIQHRTVHKRAHACALCPKRFDREDQLKKHLFAHPAELRTCGVCGYAAQSTDALSQHIADQHGLQFCGEPIAMNQGGFEGERGGLDEGGFEEHGGAAVKVDSRGGQRIDAICSQLSTSVASGYSHAAAAHGAHGMHAAQTHGAHGMKAAQTHGAVVVKQELCDTYEGDTNDGVHRVGSELGNHGITSRGGSELGGQSGHTRVGSQSGVHDSSLFPVDQHPAVNAAAAAAAYSQFLDQFPWPARFSTGLLPSSSSSSVYASFGRPVSTGGVVAPNYSAVNLLTAAAVVGGRGGLSSAGLGKSLQPLSVVMATTDDRPPALPGIHEVFSRARTSTNQTLPSFANFMPTVTQTKPLTAPPPDLPPNPPGHPQPHQLPPTVPHVSAVPPANTLTQRPTAQLPPIAHALRQIKSPEIGAPAGFNLGGGQIAQQLLPSAGGVAAPPSQLAGFPSLDDVLAYYISQGRLFKCAHCNILFFERGMYFLHASLHGPTSAWECSICRKHCADKNEFTLHFVNQQHNS